MKLLTLNEQRTLHHRYKQNDLYRQWSPILAMLQRKYDEADAQTLWHQAELQIIRLRGEKTFREQEIAPVYNELLADSQKFDEAPRSDEQAQRTAATVMCILLTELMNAVEKGHEEETFDNEPMCMAILDILLNDPFPQSLMKLFFERNEGYDGQKVVIKPGDPMLEKTLFESMDEVAQEEIQLMVDAIINHTLGLKAILKDDWTQWESLWQDILADTQMMLLIKEIEPNRNSWGFNQKMVCNVIGIYKDKTKLPVSIKALGDAISPINVRSYISNPADFEGSDSVFNREQYGWIKQLIEKRLLST